MKPSSVNLLVTLVLLPAPETPVSHTTKPGSRDTFAGVAVFAITLTCPL